ncbi:MAG: ribulose-phosphate 3-epimerase [Flavobacteriales bacterium]|nr:ribulose-phosphate 3-epimerase [Flavobacteriales bacterium]
MSHIIAPSILSSDFANLQKESEMLDKSQADWFHIDVMDGVFVPNLTFGMPVIKAIRKYSDKVFDVHLMIENPDKFIKDFKNSGADILTVHYEACTHLHRTIQSIKNEGMKAGVALNPHTNINVLEDIIKDLDLVLIMSVNPGFGGQSFIENTYSKIKKLKELILKTNSHALIEIDGGVTDKNARQLIDCGADALVAGSFVFNSNNPSQTIKNLKNI